METLCLKKKFIIKSEYGVTKSPYKAVHAVCYVKETGDLVIVTSRLVRSEEQPDEWHSFVRRFKGENYWSHGSAVRIKNFLQINDFVMESIERMAGIFE